MSTRILIADEKRMISAGLRAALDKQSDFDIVGEVHVETDAVNVVRETQPDVVIMDISMQGLNGIEMSRRMADELPSVKILILGKQSDKNFVSAAFDAGVSGYLLKESAFEKLVEAVRSVAAGEAYVCSGVKDAANEALEHGSSPLTAREREVLKLIAESCSSKEIAARLHVSIKTVSTHRQHIMDKLGIHEVAGLTRYAIEHGLVDSS